MLVINSKEFANLFTFDQ
jgi:hypothetical protein